MVLRPELAWLAAFSISSSSTLKSRGEVCGVVVVVVVGRPHSRSSSSPDNFASAAVSGEAMVVWPVTRCGDGGWVVVSSDRRSLQTYHECRRATVARLTASRANTPPPREPFRLRVYCRSRKARVNIATFFLGGLEFHINWGSAPNAAKNKCLTSMGLSSNNDEMRR